MISSVTFFLPCIVGLVWMIMYLFRRKNTTQKILTVLVGLEVLHCACQAFYVAPNTDYVSMCRWDIVSAPIILSTIAVGIIFIHAHYEGKIMPLARMELLLIPVIIQTVMQWTLYYMIGFDNVVHFVQAKDIALITQPDVPIFASLPMEFHTESYHLMYFVNDLLFNFWCVFLLSGLIALCLTVSYKHGYHIGDGFRYWFKDRKTTPARAASYWMMWFIIINGVRIYLGRTYIYSHPTLGITMALLITIAIFCMCYCEYFSHVKSYSLYALSHIDILYEQEMALSKAEGNNTNAETVAQKDKAKEETNEDKNENGKEENIQEDVIEEQSSAMKYSKVEARNNDLLERLRYKLEVEKVFCNSDLTLEGLAKQLGTNRNKLSAIGNQLFGTDFRNYIAQLRVEEAKTFMRQNPTATTETVAIHCGFKDSSAFFHRFKDIVGETPRMWLAKEEK